MAAKQADLAHLYSPIEKRSPRKWKSNDTSKCSDKT